MQGEGPHLAASMPHPVNKILYSQRASRMNARRRKGA